MFAGGHVELRSEPGRGTTVVYEARAEGGPRGALERDVTAVLVGDVVMPGLGGRDLADELRRRRPGLPVVFVSGYAEGYVVESAREDGATAFVEKPFAADDLLAAVRRVLDA
jgi:FixJ family two-component response regulator